MIKKLLTLAIIATLFALFSGCATKQAADTTIAAEPEVTFVVNYEGPGGHSSGAYGRVNAVHAAARTITALEALKPQIDYTVNEFSGGNSVNSIAFNGKVVITVRGTKAQVADFTEVLKQVVAKGIDDENAFRKVTPGTVDKTGRRMDVRANISIS